MKNKNILFIFVALILVTICFCFVPEEVLARAGGGGGGKGGGFWGLILAPFFIIYSAIVTYLVVKKNKKCKSLLEQLATSDSSWDIDKIKAQVEIAFFKIQDAWMKRDQEIAKEYMSERLYTKHKVQTDQMLSEKRKNILERINLKEARIVEVADYEDDSKDRIWVYIKGSMIDYIIDETTGKVVSGDKSEAENFSELWKFVRSPQNKWVLDEIDQKVQISDLTDFNSFSEELNAQPAA